MAFQKLIISKTKFNRLSPWQRLQKLIQDFWKSWNDEYLIKLNVGSNWNTGKSSLIKLGSLVVLEDKNLPPLGWALGRIIKTYSGDDGITRAVAINPKKGIFKKGVKKVSPLLAEIDKLLSD